MTRLWLEKPPFEEPLCGESLSQNPMLLWWIAIGSIPVGMPIGVRPLTDVAG
jgi:hypothetical protein